MFNKVWRNVTTVILDQKVAKFILLGSYSMLAMVSSGSTNITSQMVGLLAIACIGFTIIFNLSKDEDVKYIITMMVSVFIPLLILLRGCYIALNNIVVANNFHYQVLCAILFIHFVWLFSIVFFDGNRQDMIHKLNELFKKS
jgi:hypothetical protein